MFRISCHPATFYGFPCPLRQNSASPRRSYDPVELAPPRAPPNHNPDTLTNSCYAEVFSIKTVHPSPHTSSHSFRTLHRCCVLPQTPPVLLVSLITAAVTCNSPCIPSVGKISCPVELTLNKLLYKALNHLCFISSIRRLLRAEGEGKRF